MSSSIYKGFSRMDLIRYLEDHGKVNIADRMRSCKNKWNVLKCNACNSINSYEITCQVRICDKCNTKYNRLIKRYKRAIEFMDNSKLVTVTLKNVDQLKSHKIDLIRKYFHQLKDRLSNLSRLESIQILKDSDIQDKKRSKYISICSKYGWDFSVKGGLYSIEVTHKGNGWNIHIHSLLDSKYIPQPIISSIWMSLTGSYIVDVRDVDKGSGLHYVSKYLTKPPVFDSKRKYLRYLEATENKKMLNLFGDLYNWKEKFQEVHGFSVEDLLKGSCPDCGSTDLVFLGTISGKDQVKDPPIQRKLFKVVPAL